MHPKREVEHDIQLIPYSSLPNIELMYKQPAVEEYEVENKLQHVLE